MDKRVVLTAAVVVAFLLASSILVAFYNPTVEDKEINLIARVNNEGSGIYIDADYSPGDFVTIDSSGNITYNVDGWRGKIFGTPGTTTIQHMQLQDIVINKLGLSFVNYSEGSSSKECVYYIPSITNAAAFAATPVLTGAIIWEPQYHAALNSTVRKAVSLMTTDQFDPGHTCCVIAAQHRYIESHPAETVRFLAAYVKSVNWVNDALSDKSSDKYAKLVEIASKRTGGIFPNEVLEEAMDSVFYTYGMTGEEDKPSAPLLSLEAALEEIVNNYYKLPDTLKRTMADLGFSSVHEFAQRFVNDGYLVQALDFVPSPSGYSKTSVSVAVIAGDIHQIAIHAGIDLGFFSEYGITINVSSASNGPG
ncbi:MAG: ABC transporter substrate-binding protein, partial [Candidatus Methanomethylophilaceae archaeon]|nr:ABC transporter substrate-binding protein [Candidatus Methanomethylophilaceae archaeon]